MALTLLLGTTCDRLHISPTINLTPSSLFLLPCTGTISTFAGTGAKAFAGDGGSASAASLYRPYGVAERADGSVLICDYVSSTLTPLCSLALYLLPLTLYRLSRPCYPTPPLPFTLYVPLQNNHRIRMVAADGTHTSSPTLRVRRRAERERAMGRECTAVHMKIGETGRDLDRLLFEHA
jgi:hypothetical protein